MTREELDAANRKSVYGRLRDLGDGRDGYERAIRNGLLDELAATAQRHAEDEVAVAALNGEVPLVVHHSAPAEPAAPVKPATRRRTTR